MCGDPKNISTCSPAKRVGGVDSREAGNRSRVKLKRKKIERCIAPNGSIRDSNRIFRLSCGNHANESLEYNSKENTNLDMFRTRTFQSGSNENLQCKNSKHQLQNFNGK